MRWVLPCSLLWLVSLHLKSISSTPSWPSLSMTSRTTSASGSPSPTAKHLPCLKPSKKRTSLISSTSTVSRTTNVFNNSGFFTSNQKDGDADFGPMFWKLGTKNFESFFSGLSLMKTRSLTLTNEVLEERKHINVTIAGLTLKIHMQLTKMEELRKTKQMIEKHSDQINANKDFKYTVTVSKGDKVEITDGKCTTNCSKCSISYHFPCSLSVTAAKLKCVAMGRHGLCKSCPLKCKWELHLNQNYHWEFQEVTETSITYEDILQKYEEAVQHKLSTEGVLQALIGI